MPEYNLYCLDGRGHIASRDDIMAADDFSAIEVAQANCKDNTIEVWQGKRRVIQVRRKLPSPEYQGG